MKHTTRSAVFLTLVSIYFLLVGFFTPRFFGGALSNIIAFGLFIIPTIVTYYLIFPTSKDNFTFEVTPQKKSCLATPYHYYPPSDLCPYCCPRGMRKGIPINFEYSGDAERGNPCENCGCSYGV